MTIPIRPKANTGAWSQAAKIVQAGDRAREEDARKRVEEREAAGIEPSAIVFRETWEASRGWGDTCENKTFS